MMVDIELELSFGFYFNFSWQSGFEHKTSHSVGEGGDGMIILR
jgi:hypothetical protein